MDLEALLAPRDDTPPSGDNLEYDDAFVAMEIAARPGEERQAGKEILEAEDPDFADVARKALAVLEKSHDLRAGTTLAGALLFTRGLPGFAEGTAYIRGCLERWWESCHPELDAADDDDPTMRINALQALGALDPVQRGLRTTPLTESRTFGRVALRDILVAHGQMAPAGDAKPVFDTAKIDAAFKDTDPERLATILQGAQAALANMRAIEKVFAERTPGQGPRLSEVVKLLQQIVQHMAAATGADIDPPAAEEAETSGDGEQAEAPVRVAAARTAGPGEIVSSQDVRNALDAIINYYRKNEPSSPVPILLERAKRLVGADFMDILSDLAPNGVDNVKLIGGLGNAKE